MRTGVVRFAIGPPDGLTSNAWRMWKQKDNSVYIKCRDNFQDAKVSLHPSGRWRMGFTAEAAVKYAGLVGPDQNRAWEVWDRPPETYPESVVAFHLIFPASELVVHPDKRDPSKWAKVRHVEVAPRGKVAVVTLVITSGDLAINYDPEPSFTLASLDIGNQRRAQLVAHHDPEGPIPGLIERSVAKARRQTELASPAIPDTAYGYFFGQFTDGSRYLFGARYTR